jgi:hypothetical protein
MDIYFSYSFFSTLTPGIDICYMSILGSKAIEKGDIRSESFSDARYWSTTKLALYESTPHAHFTHH